MSAKRPTQNSNLERLQVDYPAASLVSNKVVRCLLEQITALIDRAGVTLGVPIESRVKSWGSIKEKIERQSLSVSGLDDIQDLSGVRIILLFRDDLKTMDALIKEHLDVLSYEDTSGRLEHDQFGYQSNHYSIKIPDSWSKIPSYADLSGKMAEIQVRTVAQHIWAAASHKLQYKREDSVPPPLRRSINRVSALLETVDLEFTRILAERKEYVIEKEERYGDDEILNVDLLARVLADIYPEENADHVRPQRYDVLLKEVGEFGISTVKELKDILIPERESVLKDDKIRASQFDPSEEEDDDGIEETIARTSRGVFYTHIGLARVSLSRWVQT